MTVDLPWIGALGLGLMGEEAGGVGWPLAASIVGPSAEGVEICRACTIWCFGELPAFVMRSEDLASVDLVSKVFIIDSGDFVPASRSLDPDVLIFVGAKFEEPANDAAGRERCE